MGIFALLVAFAALGSVLWLRNQLAHGVLDSSIICLDADYLARKEASLWTQDRRDNVVVETIQFNTKRLREGLLWPLRGAAIHLTYTMFWPVRERRALGEGLEARMRTCSSVNARTLAEARERLSRQLRRARSAGS